MMKRSILVMFSYALFLVDCLTFELEIYEIKGHFEVWIIERVRGSDGFRQVEMLGLLAVTLRVATMEQMMKPFHEKLRGREILLSGAEIVT